MTIYSRRVPHDAPSGAVDNTARHVRAHLSSIASETDSETEFADEVRVTYTPVDGATLITGELDREPVAPYLRENFDPEQDIATNPLSVPSILEGQ